MVQPNAYSNNGQYGGEFISQNINATSDSFPMPDDPTLFEIELLDALENQYTKESQQWSINSILHSLHKVVGGELGIRILDAITPEAVIGEFPIDDDGYLITSGCGISYSSILFTRMSQNEYSNAMRSADSEYHKVNVEAQYRGLILGIVPNYINDAFDAVFRLIGAKKVRDDRDDDIPDGCILWQGEYMGRTVFIEQRYNLRSNFNGMPLLSACAMNEKTGKSRIDDLSVNDLERLKSIGMSIREIRDGEARGEIRHDNVGDIIDIAYQLQV